MINRRAILALAASAGILAGAPQALALTEDEARAHVTATIEELTAMLKAPGTAESRAKQLRSIMSARGNLPLIAKFSAGRAWREMNESQQERFVDAFSHYVSLTYARRFNEYTGEPKVEIGKTLDFGKKGIVVETPFNGVDGQRLAVEWRVSDRGGRIEIIDLVFEGISLATTQREEIAAMLQKRGGDVERLISDLASWT